MLVREAAECEVVDSGNLMSNKMSFKARDEVLTNASIFCL